MIIDASARGQDEVRPQFDVGIAPASAGPVVPEQAASCQPSWLPTFGPALGVNAIVSGLGVFDDGSGAALYAGGFFTTAGGVTVNHIAKWNGASWSALGSGLDGFYVRALTVFDDGSGPALYVGGAFTKAGGVVANNVARWDGASWTALGSGVNGEVQALAGFDDGSGPALYAGGYFTTAGVVQENYVARWDGSSWSALGSGMSDPVVALSVFDDGGGQALYAGGAFTMAGGVAANYFAKWNGSSWSAVGRGMSSVVDSLTVFDDGSGSALYAGGQFGTAGSVAANGIVKWNGSTWSALGSGIDGVVTILAAFDDGSGPALYAGGTFTTAGGEQANDIAKWNGLNWSALGSGMDNSANALAVFDDGSGPALYAGGPFTNAIDSHDSYLARWGGCPVTLAAWTDLGFDLPGSTGAPLLVATGGVTSGSAGKLTLSNAAQSARTLLCISLASTPAPFKGGTLVPNPVLWSLWDLTSGDGVIVHLFHWPAGIPSGTAIFIQYAIQDGGAVQGIALSNALRADVP